MLKTLVDNETGIMLAADIVEGKAIDDQKEFVQEMGATAAVTLRITRPYWGQGRILVADAWFGSYKLAYALLEKGWYSVMNVKNNTKHFPKKKLIAACPDRGDASHMKVTVEGKHTVYGSCHRDKAPMALVHTTGTSLPGPERQRNWSKYLNGRMVFRKYTLAQPQVHSIYRDKFSAVDIHNKWTFGPQSLQYPFKTRSWQMRFWFALAAISETNAFLAHNKLRSFND